MQTREKNDVEKLTEKLSELVIRGNYEEAQRIIETDNDDVRSLTNDNYNQLIAIAIVYCNDGVRDFISSLIQAKSVDLNQRNAHGHTLILIAANYGRFDFIKFLVKNGADVNQGDSNARTPLYWAAYQSNLDLVKILLENGADVNQADRDGYFPLWSVAQIGCLEIVKILLENGANMNQATAYGKTTIHYAVDYNNPEAVSALLDAGADPSSALTELHAARLTLFANAGTQPDLPHHEPEQLQPGFSFG